MSESSTTAGGSRKPSDKKLGLFARIRLFFRQVIGELKKVVRPTRKELGQLFLTVLVFVAIMMVIVTVVDIAFGELVFKVFG